jgi:hypothetical protein
LKKCAVLFLLTCLQVLVLPVANAAIVSKAYVDGAMVSAVKTSGETTQTMAGDYTVTGALKVPTQPLPSAN